MRFSREKNFGEAQPILTNIFIKELAKNHQLEYGIDLQGTKWAQKPVVNGVIGPISRVIIAGKPMCKAAVSYWFSGAHLVSKTRRFFD